MNDNSHHFKHARCIIQHISYRTQQEHCLDIFKTNIYALRRETPLLEEKAVRKNRKDFAQVQTAQFSREALELVLLQFPAAGLMRIRCWTSFHTHGTDWGSAAPHQPARHRLLPPRLALIWKLAPISGRLLYWLIWASAKWKYEEGSPKQSDNIPTAHHPERSALMASHAQMSSLQLGAWEGWARPSPLTCSDLCRSQT